MIIVDCEMTGLDPKRSSILSIGAVDIHDPTKQFYGECRAWEGAYLDPAGLAVCGFTEAECLNPNKWSLEKLMTEFYEFLKTCKGKTLAGQNVYLDMFFLNDSFARAGINYKFAYRIVDVHTVAFVDHITKGIKMPLNDEGRSALNLDRVLQYVGIPEEPKPHNALTGAKVSAEALLRIIYGKKLLSDFEKYELPEILKK